MKFKYKNYTGEAEWDEGAQSYNGIVIGITDVIHFCALEKKDLEKAFHDSVEDYLASCKESNKRPQKSYSGKLLLRIDPRVHARIAAEAEYKGLSVNSYIEQKLNKKL